ALYPYLPPAHNWPASFDYTLTGCDRAPFLLFFFFTDAPTAEFYTLSLHDGSSDLVSIVRGGRRPDRHRSPAGTFVGLMTSDVARSEEHTSELQSRENLVCRLLLEKKNKS